MTGGVPVALAGAIGDRLHMLGLRHRGGLNLARLHQLVEQVDGWGLIRQKEADLHARFGKVDQVEAGPSKPGAETGQHHASDVLLAPILWGPRRPGN
jgi:hypothetical protein